MIRAGYLIDIPENSRGEQLLDKEGNPLQVKIPIYVHEDTDAKMKEKIGKIGGVWELNRNDRVS
jgi:hypothetical protein